MGVGGKVQGTSAGFGGEDSSTETAELMMWDPDWPWVPRQTSLSCWRWDQNKINSLALQDARAMGHLVHLRKLKKQ